MQFHNTYNYRVLSFCLVRSRFFFYTPTDGCVQLVIRQFSFPTTNDNHHNTEQCNVEKLYVRLYCKVFYLKSLWLYSMRLTYIPMNRGNKIDFS